ncbi:pantothenate kinase [Helicobacter pylori]|uniref:pantothenate kinase n=1 Tax=Helicobacter pylori TaxID=210 RepID=UPI0019315445|nr:pantothenate kinase [Helicobacter pylori]MBM0611923.1 pantothenate kinase [Helicobacter pylori]MBM0628344.1 pantothenate kinase [Helicobacter pylori]
MSGLKAFSCVVVLCGAMANVAIASPKIEARGQLGRDIGGDIGSAMGAARGPAGAAIGGQLGREIGDRVEDLIRDFIDREPQAKEPQNKEPQAPREPIRDLYDYGYSFGHAW